MDREFSSERLTYQAISMEDRLALLPFFQDKDELYYYLPTKLKEYDLESLKKELDSWDDGEENLAWSLRLKDGTTVGVGNFEGIDRYNLTAELGLMLTEAEFRGKGYATEAAKRLLDHAFEDLGLRRVSCRVMAGNAPSFSLVERLGFRPEGVQKSYQRRGDRFLDMHHFAMLKEEWFLQRQKL